MSGEDVDASLEAIPFAEISSTQLNTETSFRHIFAILSPLASDSQNGAGYNCFSREQVETCQLLLLSSPQSFGALQAECSRPSVNPRTRPRHVPVNLRASSKFHIACTGSLEGKQKPGIVARSRPRFWGGSRTRTWSRLLGKVCKLGPGGKPGQECFLCL